MLLACVMAFLQACAKEEPIEYYVHLSKDLQMEKHLQAAKEAFADLEIELAQSAFDKAMERLGYLSMTGHSDRLLDHYKKELSTLSEEIEKIEKEGVPVRIAFSVGYDPEELEPASDVLKLGDLRRRMMSAPYSRRVEVNHLILYYVKGPGRKQYNLYLKRLAPYRKHILRVFRSHGVPDEMIAVAMIESAGKPDSVSHAGAAGMWQFIPETARNYGLIVGDTVDQRFDPIIETYAAARYLRFLLNKFDNKVGAALASYNCGEGYIEQVLAHPSIRNIWHAPYHGKGDDPLTPTIPRETYDYVARWYAVAIVYQNMDQYDFAFPVTTEDPFILVHVDGELEVAALSEDLDIQVETLVGMNPSLKVGRTPPGETTAVRLPPAPADDYAERLREAKRYRISYVYRHKVTSYQTLRKVAQSYGVSALRISEVNDLGEQVRLDAGTIIKIPTVASNTKALTASAQNIRYWRAFKDTLWDKKEK